MSKLSRSYALLSALSLASLLAGGCDPKGVSGAIGSQPAPKLDIDEKGAAAPTLARPMPDSGGVTPTLPPQIDPLHDPIDPESPKTLDVQGPEAPLPWKLTNPAASSGCKCRLVCAPANDDRSKDCITMCEGTGC